MTEKLVSKNRPQRGNRVQIHRLIRWQFKLETDQVLKVTVKAIGLWGSNWESFLAKMSKDGRVVIPQLILDLLKKDKPSFDGYIMEIKIKPF